MDIELSIKKSYVTKSLKALAFSVVVAMFMGCAGRDNYPVVEISEELTQAVQAFSEVSEFHDSLAVVSDGSYYGVIDMKGNTVIPCEYHNLEPCGKFFYAENEAGHWSLIDRNGKELIPYKEYKDYKKEISVFPDDEIIRYYDEDNHGYYFADFNGNKLFDKGLSMHFVGEGAVAFHEGLACAHLSPKNYSWYGYVDKTGKTIIEPRYAEPASFFDGIAFVTQTNDGLKGQRYFIDKQGNIVMSLSRKDGLLGLVDKSGKEIIPCQFASIGKYDSGYVLTIGTNKLCGVWSIKDNKEIVAPKYEIFPNDDNMLGCKTFIKDSIIIVYKNGAGGAINMEGNEIVPCRHGFVEVEKGFIKVTHGNDVMFNKKGLYDREGNEILKCEYRNIDIGENSIIACKEDEKDDNYLQCFLFDHKGNLLFQAKSDYDMLFNIRSIKHLSEGLAAVKKDGTETFGFYDADGDEVIAPRYEDAGTFSEGLAPVKLNGKWGYVNREGVDTFGNK